VKPSWLKAEFSRGSEVALYGTRLVSLKILACRRNCLSKNFARAIGCRKSSRLSGYKDNSIFQILKLFAGFLVFPASFFNFQTLNSLLISYMSKCLRHREQIGKRHDRTEIQERCNKGQYGALRDLESWELDLFHLDWILGLVNQSSEGCGKKLSFYLYSQCRKTKRNVRHSRYRNHGRLCH